MSKVIIAICAYNVEETLEKTIANMPDGIADEVIVVDDGSSDRTVDLAHKLEETLHMSVIVHPENRGYGAVQKTAYTAAMDRGADVIALLHGDFQYDPASLPLLISPLLAHGADMTFGSRFASDGDPMAGGMPAYRFIGNRITTVLENSMIGTRFTDMHSGMRAFNRKCLLSLPFLSYRNDFTFDKQTTVDAVMAGLRVTEIPIPTRYDNESSSIPTIGSFRYVWHSLAYTAQTAAKKGKRGRRWEVRSRRTPRLARTEPDLRSMWSLASSFVVPDGRVLIAGSRHRDEIRSIVAEDGGEVATVGSGGEGSEIGTVLADGPSEADLRVCRERLHHEGLLVGVAREAETVGLMKEAGFRPVTWDRSGIFAARLSDAVSG